MTIEGIPKAPAPWQLQADVFFFLGWSWTPQLPPGSFDPAEEDAIRTAACSTLVRTPYAIQLYRYKTSPVGPYDEIMFIPGFFATQVKNEKGDTKRMLAPRITRIYVSTEATCLRGRENWNVPKHLADFSFEYAPSGEITVKVCPKGQAEPFFAASITVSKSLPSFPFSTSWMPFSLSLLQPPLPRLDEVVTGTSDWQHTPLKVTMKETKVAYTKPLLNGGKDYADGVGFPNIAPFSAGLYSQNTIVDFMTPTQSEVVPYSAGVGSGVKQD